MDGSYILADPAQVAGSANKSAPNPSSCLVLSLEEEPGGFYNYHELPKLHGCVCVCRVYIFVYLSGSKVDVKCLSSLFTFICLRCRATH